MTDLIEWMAAADARCPLLIERADYDEPQLHLGGSDWSFSASVPWRVVRDYIVRIGASDNQARSFVRELLGQSVIGFRPLVSTPNFDVGFKLTTGDELQVLCTHTHENWVLRLPGMPTMPFVPAS
jgi:hypothetical protein